MKYASIIGNLLLICAMTLLSLLSGELIFRVIDGYKPISLDLVSTRPARPLDPQFVDRAAQYAKQIRLDSDFRLKWFDSDFQSIESIVNQRHRLDHPLPQDWVRAVK